MKFTLILLVVFSVFLAFLQALLLVNPRLVVRAERDSLDTVDEPIFELFKGDDLI